MGSIRGGHNHDVGNAATGEQLLDVGKACGIRELMWLSESGSTHRVGVDHRGVPQPVGVGQGPRSKGVVSSLTRSDGNCCESRHARRLPSDDRRELLFHPRQLLLVERPAMVVADVEGVDGLVASGVDARQIQIEIEFVERPEQIV